MIPDAQKLGDSSLGQQEPKRIPQLVTLEALAELWHLPLTWLRENCRSRCADPLPIFRCGRYVRLDLRDPALAQWLNRRRVVGRTR
jgi:hypothetical protein